MAQAAAPVKGGRRRRDHSSDGEAEEESKFDAAEVYEVGGMLLFWAEPAFACQWTPSRFKIDGVSYNCAEQWMMASKARLFGDLAALQKIMAAEHPREQKALGGRVTPFVAKEWDSVSLQVVVHGNYAKFTQNEGLREELLSTGTKELVEASPYDKIWGIGLRADAPEAADKSQWRGENKLGEALMTVRELIRKGEEPPELPRKLRGLS